MPGMIVAGTFRRKTKMTATTRKIVSINSNSTSCTEARIVVVRSEMTETSMDDGRDARSCGSTFWMRSTRAMMLVPGWRWIFRRTAGVGITQAACLTFSALSMIVATSERRIGRAVPIGDDDRAHTGRRREADRWRRSSRIGGGRQRSLWPGRRWLGRAKCAGLPGSCRRKPAPWDWPGRARPAAGRRKC